MYSQKIQEANARVWTAIDGWVGDRIHHMLKFVDALHVRHAASGDVAEIGVHHGKLFFILASLLRDGEKAIAIDLFEDQARNVDKSGGGSMTRFARHQETLFPELAGRITVLQADSLSITPATARGVIGTDGLRVVSVDGGHTVEHVVNDLSLANELLLPYGVVLLDDFFGPQWPTVTEGFFKYMATRNTRLAPFLIFQNKLFLTTYSEHGAVRRAPDDFVMAEVPGEWAAGRWRASRIGDTPVLCFA